ncbi:ADP-ribosylation factor-like protein 5B isoform X1 [Meriones unguiculatus]|nr:ADP-ribosylation factor-like protein 5B isoform X1 [Meriones unguiculatus]
MMGLIFAKLWSLFCNQEHKVIIVGLDNAGKTTILYQFLMNEVVHTSPTIGSNVEEIVVKNTHFLMWDIGGQESLRSSWNTYYSNTEFIILVVDSIDRERLAITKEELYRMLAHEDLRKAAVLIFANKQDMKGCMTAAEISKYLTLSSIKDHPWHIQSCCALTGEGLWPSRGSQVYQRDRIATKIFCVRENGPVPRKAIVLISDCEVSFQRSMNKSV